MIQIESNIPIPVTVSKYELFPHTKLRCRQSFVFTTQDGDINLVRQAISQHGRRTNKKFMTRKLSPTSWRIWRIK